MRIISTGEALPRELAERLLPMARELWNLYGPTETTVYSALCRVEPGDARALELAAGEILADQPVLHRLLALRRRRDGPHVTGIRYEGVVCGCLPE